MAIPYEIFSVYTIPFSFHTGLGIAIPYEIFSIYTIPFSFHTGLGWQFDMKFFLFTRYRFHFIPDWDGNPI